MTQNRHGLPVLDRPSSERRRPVVTYEPAPMPDLPDAGPIPSCAGQGCTRQGLISHNGEQWWCESCISVAVVQEARR